MKTSYRFNCVQPLNARFPFTVRVVALLLAALAPQAALQAQSNYTTPYTFTTIAGVAAHGSTDGVGSAARFYHPNGIAKDVAGNFYVADSENHTVRKITPAGVVSTLAGLAGSAGSEDGTDSAARFLLPFGLAVDGSGTIYVADAGNHTIRKITSSGVVTTLAGSAGAIGSMDGTGSEARFFNPHGVTLDASGNVYVADMNNHVIRKITPAGVVTTFAGIPNGMGFSDGSGGIERFNKPFGITIDSSGDFYVADSANHTIRKITPGGVVSTLAGSAMNMGSTDGVGSAARFNYPYGVAVDESGSVFVTDSGNSTVRKISSAGAVTTLAGFTESVGSLDGTGSAAQFYGPSGVVVDGTGSLLVVDSWNERIRKITPAGVVTTFAGATGGAGSVDGAGSVARFSSPVGVAVDGSGNVYVADKGNSTIRKIAADGVVTTFAGLLNNNGLVDGTGSAARFGWPNGLAVDGSGNVYVADTGHNAIRKITPAGEVTTLAGATDSSYGSTDGAGSAARFKIPLGVAVDGVGNVYVADAGNSTIRKIVPDGTVTTIAGAAGNPGSVDGLGNEAKFSYPMGVAVDGAGNVYVADNQNNTIRKITAAGMVTTLAGNASSSGSTDGTGSAARFFSPRGVTVDAAGNVYVADTDNSTIRRITPEGVVSTVAGLANFQLYGWSDGTGSEARFYGPWGITMDGAGNLYVVDTSNNTIHKGVPLAGPSLTAQTPWQKVFAGNTATFSVTSPTATGYQWERSTDSGSTWTTLSSGGAYAGVTTATLTVSGVNSAMNGWQFRAVVSNVGGSVTSAAAPLTIIPTTPGLLWNAMASPYPYLLPVATPRGIDVNVTAVSAGGLHTMFLKTDGTLWAAGYNSNGQLGVVTSDPKVQSTPLLVTNGVSSVAVGNIFTMFIKTDGTLWGTGYNSDGQLGDGTTVSRSAPVLIATGVASVAAGYSHTLFIKTDGTLWAMGANFYGQLGDGTTVGKSTPVQIASGVASVSASAQGTSSYFVKSNGTLWAMGGNSYGQLGDGTTVGKIVPVQIASDVTKVSGGAMHALYRKSDASLWAMGYNVEGQLGDGTTAAKSSPIPIATGVTDISAGSSHSLYIKADGTAWGMGANGALGTGTGSFNQLSPVQLNTACASVSAGSGYSMFIRTDGTLLAAGNNLCGQLGDRQPAPSEAPLDSGVMTVSSRGIYVKSDGTAWQTVGAGGTQIAGISGAIQASVASGQNWYLKSDGSLWSQFSLIDTNVVSFDTGTFYAVYLKSDGTLWGKGGTGASILFGGGNDPAQIAANVVSFSAADRHILFVKDDQTLWGMGRLTSGWLDGSSPFQYVSIPVQLETGILSASASTYGGNRYIKADGTLWARGDGWGASTGPAVLVDNDVVSVAISGINTWYLKADRILRYRSGPLNALGPVVEVTGGVSSVSGNASGPGRYIQDTGFGTLPTISTQPQSVAAASGATVTLQAITTGGTGPMQYQWYKDGVAVSWGQSAQYIIPALISSDVGNYTVKITNSAGVVTSDAAVVANTPLAAAITAQPVNQIVALGSSVEFTIGAVGIPAPTYQWQKNGVSIAGATSSSYVIASVGSGDAGSYTVVVTNPTGSVTSNPAVLETFIAPPGNAVITISVE